MARFSFNNFFESLSKLISEDEQAHRGPKRNPQQVAHELEIQHAILVLAAEVVKCNRNFTRETEDFIRRFFATQFTAKIHKQIPTTINDHLEIGTEPLLKISCKELKLLTTHPSRMRIVEFLFGVANADDFVTPRELRCINRIATYLGLTAHDFTQIKEAFNRHSSPYVVLGVDETASLEQVKTAYRKMVLKYHPDKRAPTITENDANSKFREIQRAFELIKENLEAEK